MTEGIGPLVPLLFPCCAGTSPLLCGDKPPALRGQAQRWREMQSRSYWIE
jgi:hypothetical protein